MDTDLRRAQEKTHVNKALPRKMTLNGLEFVLNRARNEKPIDTDRSICTENTDRKMLDDPKTR